MKIKTKLIFLLILFSINYSYGAFLIRDAETEDYIRLVLDEILGVSGINPKTVNLFILKDDDINAFVYNGPNMVVNTGLIQSSESYEIVQAVLAHEVGHIKGSHIIHMNLNAKNAIAEALFYSIGGALIALTGGGVGAAIITGAGIGTNVAEKRFLGYTRSQEREADFHASEILTNLKSSGQGAIDIFEKFKDLQARRIEMDKIDKYSTTHPFPEDRLEYFKYKFSKLNYQPTFKNDLQKKHIFVNAKLAGYFNNVQTLYPTNFKEDASAKLYFQGFDEFRKGNFAQSIKIFEALSKEDSKNPYLLEAIATAFQKNEDFNSSIEFYHKALTLKPRNFHFLFGIAESYFLKKDYKSAIKYMTEAWVMEPYNPQIPYKLAFYYNASGEFLIAKIFFLESEVLRENYPKAKDLLKQIKLDANFKNNVIDESYIKKVQNIEQLLKTK